MDDKKNSHNDEQYMAHHPIEIAQILTELAKNKTMLNLSFNHGQEQGLTTIIGVNREKKAVYLDMSLDGGFNKKLLNTNSIVFTKSDGVKIRWTSHKITTVKLKDGEALKIALPNSLFRFQRREYFRSPTPTANPVICYTPYHNPTTNHKEVFEMTLVDASLGGVGTVVSGHLSPAVEIEKVFEHCKINLPNMGEIEVTLCVKNITEITLKNGAKKHRVGFEFVGLPHADLRLVQNYVSQLEREALVLARGE